MVYALCLHVNMINLCIFQTHKAEMMFSESAQDRRDKKAEQKRQELKELRESLMSGNKDNVLDQFEDLLNSSANKIKKTKVELAFL